MLLTPEEKSEPLPEHRGRAEAAGVPVFELWRPDLGDIWKMLMRVIAAGHDGTGL